MAGPGCGRSWCLRRVGMDAEWLLLDAGREVTIGRGVGVTYQLVSKLCPLMISRNHCVLKQNPEGQWTIMDNKSLNGVWLNGERLQPFRACVIREGDHVQLGVPLEDKENAEYEYEVAEEDWARVQPCLAPRSEGAAARRGRAKRKPSAEEPEGPAQPKARAGRAPPAGHPAEPRAQGPEAEAGRPPASSDPELAPPEASEPARPGCPLAAERQSGVELLKATVSRLLKLKTQMQEKQEAVLGAGRTAAQGARAERALRHLCSRLSAEQARGAQLERTFREDACHRQGPEEHGEEEEELRQQLARALQEHRALMEELSQSKKDFETIIQAKNRELEQTREEKEKAQAQKEEVLTHVSDVLESELQCVICSEYFLEAVTLNCAHSFCSHCISEWMKRKTECPICRKDIESKTRSLVLDNCISKMVDHLGAEARERRAELLRGRRVSFVRAQKRRTPRI